MRKKLLIVLFLSILTSISVSGCATTVNIQGKPIISSKVDTIVNGTTTGQQIISMFGPPYKIEKNPFATDEKTYVYMFHYKKYVTVGSDVLTPSTRKYSEKLDILIKNGVVVSHAFTTRGNITLKQAVKDLKNADKN